VYSSTLDDPEWTNSTRVDGDLADVVRTLKREHERDVVVHGSAQLAQSLLERDLVDELRLMVFPVVLGGGRRLFADGDGTAAFELVDCRPAAQTAILVYRRPRA
jgi:dihydrofolate reductase